MVKIAEGLKIKKETYKEFGKFMISLKFLEQNLLIVKYLSYAPVPSIRRTKISPSLAMVISFLLDTGTINYQLAQELSIKEKDLLTRLITKAGLISQLKFDPKKLEDDINDIIKKFYVLQGEVKAGNNNPDIIEQIRVIIDKLVHMGKISSEDRDEILKDL